MKENHLLNNRRALSRIMLKYILIGTVFLNIQIPNVNANIPTTVTNETLKRPLQYDSVHTKFHNIYYAGDETCLAANIVCPAVDGAFPVYGALPNCSQFCQCSNGVPYLHNCSAGLHFNPVLNVCDWPNAAGCTEGSDSGNNGNDTGDPTCLATNIACPQVDGEYPVYEPLPNCSHFCQCSNGIPYLHNCSDGLHFNPVLNVCDWPNNAGCKNDKGDLICIQANLECSTAEGNIPVYGALPNCSQYCKCSNGNSYLHNCTDDLHFNPVTNSCDSPENAGCANSTIPDNSSGDQICLDSNIACPVNDGEFPVHGALPNCSQFCICLKGKPYLQNCTDNLHFNLILNICDAPENAGCRNNSVPDNSTGDQICLDLNIECPIVDGEFPVYGKLPNCSQFCKCSNGKPYLQNCTGDLHFNPTLNICDAPENAGCKNNTIPDNITGDQICLDSNIDCPSIDGVFHVFGPLPNCSQFCMCSNGKPYLYNCTGDLHFNPTLNICDVPENAGCKNNTIPDNSTEDQICLDSNIYCPLIDGVFPVFGPLPNCSQFCKCANGKPYLHNCTGNLHFNPTLNICDAPENAGCRNNSVPDNSTGDQICLDSNIACPLIDGVFPVFGPLPNCFQFCKCSNGKPYLHNCTGDLHFNPTLNICDAPENAGCKNNSVPDNSTGDQICLDSNIDCPLIDGVFPVFGPLPNCSQFCKCSNGKPYLHNCTGDLHFNPILNICDDPENVGCRNNTIPDNSTGDQICLDLNIACPLIDGVFPVFGSLPNCSQFCMCSNGKPYLYNCTGDLHFNPTLNICDAPENAGCQNNTIPDNNTGEQICLDSNIDCPLIDGVFPVFGSLPICSQFCKCSNGKPYLHNCTGDLHFNPTLNICDAPENAGCKNNSVPDNTTGDQICLDSNIDCSLIDGVFPVFGPLPNCSQFCKCSNGKPYLHNCTGDLHFNPTLNICDAPENAGCKNNSVPDNTTGDQICLDSNIDCSLIDGVFPVFGPLPNCSQFCKCSNGKPYLHNCTGDLHFNPILNICDDPENVGCRNNTIPDNSTGDQICLDLNIACPLIDGVFPVFGSLPNCSQFCMCSNGKPYLYNCTGDLHFNPTLNICDAPENAGCQNNTIPDNNTGEQICLDSNIDCPLIDGVFPVFGSLPICSQFCKCSNGKPYLHNCTGDLHFNPTLNICDAPENAGCKNNSVPDNTTGDQICLDSNIDCSLIDGVFPVFGPLPNCSQFCKCSNGKPYLHNCTGDLHFNPILNICDDPENAGCRNNTISDNSTGDQICLDSNIDCPLIAGEFPVFGALTNCSQFCMCSNGKPYLYNCTGDLHFNPTLHICDYPDNAGCGNNSIPNNSSGDQICLDSNIDCPLIDGDLPVFGPLPNCSQFCRCSNGKPYLHNCTGDLHFNPILNICDAPENAGCANTTIPDNSTGHPICLEANIDCPLIDDDFPVYGALPNCSQFCLCSNGIPYLHNCSDGLHFNHILNICDSPENAGCQNNSRPDEEEGDQICLDTKLECPAVDGDRSIYGAVPNCSQFCLCLKGKAYLFDCPAGLHFNPVYNTCDWPHMVGCSAGNRACFDANIECPLEDGEFPVFGALPNCSQFCLCSRGTPFLFDCPGDLHFDPILNVCHWAENAGCQSNTGIIDLNDKECLHENLECSATTGESSVYYSMPNCSQYCECSNGTLRLHHCSSNLHFSPLLNTCVWGQYSGCVHRETYPVCPSSADIDCSVNDQPVFSALPNCSEYCQCSNGRPYLHHCPNDLYFSPLLNRCVWRDYSGCNEIDVNETILQFSINKIISNNGINIKATIIILFVNIILLM